MKNSSVKLLGLDNGVQARVWQRKTKENCIVLIGYAVNEDGVRLEGAKDTQKALIFGEDMEEAYRQLANKIVADYFAKNPPADDETVPENPFATAFARVEDPKILCDPSWAESTMTRTISYLCRNVIPRLDEKGLHLREKDFDSIKNELVAQTKKSKISYNKDDQALKTVMSNLHRCNVILENLRKRTSFTLQEGSFLITAVSVVQREQPKHIPGPVRLKITHALSRLAETSPLAMGMGLMLFCGLRTAESCAVTFGYVDVKEDFAVIPVKGQIRNGGFTHDLKTPAAYRYALGGDAMAELINTRITALQAQGFDGEHIKKMPLTSSLTKDSEPNWADPSALSTYGKDLLLACGYEESMLDEMKKLMKTEPDFDEDGNPITDVTTYIARRDFIGRCCNCCGMSNTDVDYLVGHKREAKGFIDYENLKVQRALAAQINRYRFDYKKLPDTGVIRLEDQQKYWLEPVDYDRVVEFSVCTNEANDEIQLSFGGEMESIVAELGELDTPAERQHRPILGVAHSKEFYDQIEEEVANMNLEDFENK